MSHLDKPFGSLDFLKDTPPLPDIKSIQKMPYAGFAYSLQGASHIKKDIPCQDRCDIRYLKLKDSQMVIAAVADGLGSCPLSHWGAYFAVKTALDEIEYGLLNGKSDIPRLMSDAFENAQNKVEELADAAKQPVAHFQSTLTVVVYLKDQLYCCHVGDDGVVTQFADGTVEMITQRMKGEDAASVYPLQTGSWKVTVSSKPVVAFLIATDGVLDNFVFDPRQISYFNGVYYSAMMGPAIYGILRNGSSKAAELCRKYMNTESYRKAVDDDLTLVAVVNRDALEHAASPSFDKYCWEEERRRWESRANAALYNCPEAKSKDTLSYTAPLHESSAFKKPSTKRECSSKELFNPKKESDYFSKEKNDEALSVRSPRKSSHLKEGITFDQDGTIRIAIQLRTVQIAFLVLCILVGAIFISKATFSRLQESDSQPIVCSDLSESQDSIELYLTEQFFQRFSQQYIKEEQAYLNCLNQTSSLLQSEDAASQLPAVVNLFRDLIEVFSASEGTVEGTAEQNDALRQNFLDLHETHRHECLNVLDQLLHMAEQIQSQQPLVSEQESDDIQLYSEWIQNSIQAEMYFVSASYYAYNEWLLSGDLSIEQIDGFRISFVDPEYQKLFIADTPFPTWQNTAEQAAAKKDENYNLYIQILDLQRNPENSLDGVNENA